MKFLTVFLLIFSFFLSAQVIKTEHMKVITDLSFIKKQMLHLQLLNFKEFNLDKRMRVASQLLRKIKENKLKLITSKYLSLDEFKFAVEKLTLYTYPRSHINRDKFLDELIEASRPY